MKVKSLVSLLLSAALLTALTGCFNHNQIAGPRKRQPPKSPPVPSLPSTALADVNPDVANQEETVSIASNLKIISENGENLQLCQHHVIDFYFQVPLEGLTCLDAPRQIPWQWINSPPIKPLPSPLPENFPSKNR